MKYIIKNCPAIEAYCTCGKYYDYNKQISTRCKDITDCTQKRIVNECKWETNIDVECRGDLAERILSELEIEECENE